MKVKSPFGFGILGILVGGPMLYFGMFASPLPARNTLEKVAGVVEKGWMVTGKNANYFALQVRTGEAENATTRLEIAYDIAKKEQLEEVIGLPVVAEKDRNRTYTLDCQDKSIVSWETAQKANQAEIRLERQIAGGMFLLGWIFVAIGVYRGRSEANVQPMNSQALAA